MNQRDDDLKTAIERSNPNGVEPPFSEDDLQRQQLGPRGVPGQRAACPGNPTRRR
ncbi:hypothetical protein QIH87_28945 [Bradyrhizobium elkanii]|uniref:Uncharacterized protein n=1 Tax=Bradyrhizobium elkanii TaxID=29448 RepID=A0A8I1YE24_BRAEL|nr:hypothetical protein [Bradyrhizobium elkanii]MBP1298037.1 hypothetical protein [Bradyrhizobium elkanii]MBP2427069.1 hypothetical protein [Bradyrhizobium elkanii]MCP1757478.1 hypothetical protein [Bradyrhizobium elkanii]MCP1970265.1 hypothetical protein [Bradyrhizobium elkanii]MCP1982992.1 hypothetical protein [Bradyrhizobium elkanii]